MSPNEMALPEKPEASSGAMRRAAIETEGLTKQYGKNRGITHVDLTVERGEVFGFLGPNGAGKTTTIRTLLGFLRPSGGRAWVFGMGIRRKSVEIRARVGNLPGEFALEDRMTGGSSCGSSPGCAV